MQNGKVAGKMRKPEDLPIEKFHLVEKGQVKMGATPTKSRGFLLDRSGK